MADAANVYLEEFGSGAAERAIMEFLIKDEKLTVPEIAKRYKVSRQHVQVTVNGLLDKKLVATVTNPDHRRSPYLRLTPNGKKLFAKITAQDERLLNKVFSDIKKADALTTRKTLEAMLNNLKTGVDS